MRPRVLSNRRLARFRAAPPLLASVLLFEAPPAFACGGPCTDPQISDVKQVGEGLYAVTNFGLLRTTSSGWHLECEELFSGVVTKTSLSETALLVASSVGFFRGDGEICSWEESSLGASNTWFLDFSMLLETRSETGTSPLVVALVNDRDTSEGKVEMAEVGQPFATLAAFEPTSGLRKLVAGGTPATVYTTGYTYGPRTWHVYGALLGDTTFDERSFDAEEDPSELTPLAVDPDDGGRLWIRAALPGDEPDALFVLDWEDAELTTSHQLEDGEKVVDLTITSDGTYLVARGGTQSSVYRAAPGTTRFERVRTVQAQLTCLNVEGDEWLACNSNFSASSPWIVARSVDEGKTWAPELTLSDLGALTSCGDVCATTSAWLYGVFGVNGPRPGGPDSSNDAGLPLRKPDAGEGPKPGATPRKASGCSLGTTSASPRDLLLMGAALGFLRHRRRRSAPNGGRKHTDSTDVSTSLDCSRVPLFPT
jgi:hypothetical protein